MHGSGRAEKNREGHHVRWMLGGGGGGVSEVMSIHRRTGFRVSAVPWVSDGADCKYISTLAEWSCLQHLASKLVVVKWSNLANWTMNWCRTNYWPHPYVHPPRVHLTSLMITGLPHFLSLFPLLCIIVGTNWRTKDGVGLGTKLSLCTVLLSLAEFAVNLDLLLSHRDAQIDPDAQRGYLESSLLDKLVTLEDLEPEADDCTKVKCYNTAAKLSTCVM